MNKSDSSLHKCNCRLTVCLIILFSFLFLLLFWWFLFFWIHFSNLFFWLLFLGSSSLFCWLLFLGSSSSSSWVPLLGFLFLGSSSGFPLLNPLLRFLLVHLLPHYKTEKHSAANILITDNNKNIYLFFDSELWDCRLYFLSFFSTSSFPCSSSSASEKRQGNKCIWFEKTIWRKQNRNIYCNSRKNHDFLPVTGNSNVLFFHTYLFIPHQCCLFPWCVFLWIAISITVLSCVFFQSENRKRNKWKSSN